MQPPAEVVDHDPEWARTFELLAARLRAVLPADVAVEHVGSTAVPGLAGKPIIDIDLVVAHPSELPAVMVALAAAGYAHRGDLGIVGREAFAMPVESPAFHHLYLVVAGSKPHRDHVDLRDYLRAHPEQAERYAAEKRRLAHLLLVDRDAYVEGKGPLVEELLAAARVGRVS